MAAFFQGLMGSLNEGIQRKHAEEEGKKQKQRDAYLQVAQNSPDPDTREWALGEWNKSLNPESRKGAKKIAPLLGKLFGAAHQQQPQQGQPARAPDPNAWQWEGGGSSAAPARAPQTGAVPPPTGLAQREEAQFERRERLKTDIGIESSGKQFQSWLQRGRDLGLKDRDLAEYAGSSGTKLPAQEKRVADKSIARPGIDAATGKPYEGLWDHIMDPDGTETWAKRPDTAQKSGYIRSVPHSVSRDDAIAEVKQGVTYEDQAGNPIDVENLPPNMGLQAMVSGSKMFWVPITPNQRTVTVGNVVYGVTPYEIKNIGQGGGTALGVSRVPTAGTSEQIAVNPVTGEVTKNTLRRATAPATPGAQPAQAPPKSAPAAPVAAPSRPGPTPTAPAPTGAPTGDVKGMPPGMYNQMLNRVIPVREAATQIFGDPSQPDLKGLKDYMPLADNAQSRERLGKALRLTFDGLNQATNGAHISADAGPISVSTGGIGSVLQNYFGVPTKLAEQQTKIMQDAIGSLTPEEREAYDSIMSSFSTVVGLRSLTRASAAQASVSAIERELPVIGVNTFDSRQFADQLQRLAEVVSNGTKGIPKGMLDPALVKRIDSLPSEMQRLKQSKSGPTKAPGSSGRPRAVNKDGKAVEWDGKAWVPAA